jgi:hypothetical protein
VLFEMSVMLPLMTFIALSIMVTRKVVEQMAPNAFQHSTALPQQRRYGRGIGRTARSVLDRLSRQQWIRLQRFHQTGRLQLAGSQPRSSFTHKGSVDFHHNLGWQTAADVINGSHTHVIRTGRHACHRRAQPPLHAVNPCAIY